MSDSDPKTTLHDLLPELKSRLQRALSVHLTSRYPMEDIVHDTYVRAIENLHTLRDSNRSNMIAWLERIAHRLVIDRIRQKQSKQTHGQEAHALYSALTASRQLTPSRECSVKEAIGAIETALTDLPEDHRNVLTLRYVDQLTFVHIAKRLDRTPGAIRGLHRTGLEILRRGMGESSDYLFR
mgnify:CR=1 FL=1